MKRIGLIKYVTLIYCLLTLQNIFSQSEKGVWLTDIASEALDSREGIREVVQRCKVYGIDHIYVVVWNRGYTLYPSTVMETEFGKKVAPRFAGRDILQELIEEAHAEGLKVHAWFEFGFSSSYQEPDGGHILRAKPDWQALDHNKKLVSKNGFQWMNAFHPEVQQFLLSLIKEVVQNYNIDGIQGDDRLPANPSTAGYDPFTIDLYKKEHDGKFPPEDYKNEDWINWRAQKLNLFAQEVYQTVNALNPQVAVTMAPSIFPWSKEEYLQDWPTWVQNGWVDKIIPQVYRYNIKAYTQTLETNLNFMPFPKRKDFIPGILLKVDEYTPSHRLLKKMIKVNRKNGLKSEVFFFYEGLKLHSNFFKKEYSKLE
ncbi:family 10 glycosylhydrolase [Arenibacter sp. GZD96]|uniref:glycoside hydrolase family 10 protein n=1 Tax=Aurantibrevibacter litoralis TaxID=3106030 RepID=UPI002AFF57AF|nr:family 10 glycosylhydrolase [Arenibacter sp. GZD-96]MEA1784812.1 family 10 glycosylhydrolase [Arenibacter sp. GZD-96]